MIIKKQGLIYCPNGGRGWDKNTFMTPHAMLIDTDTIRIWGGVRDEKGVSRITYIDVDASNPKEIKYIAQSPSLDIGKDGCFDDNGVILGDIVRVKDKIYMYYVGFQHVEKVKFFAFSGLAISHDGGNTFERYSEVPVMDRTVTGRYGRCIHTVRYEYDRFKIYYAVINDWKYINGIPYPVYNIWYTESDDGMHFELKDSTLCVDTAEDEYRIGRPKVYKTDLGYEMFYTRDLLSKRYLAGHAVSQDGITWLRNDDAIQLLNSGEGWDSDMSCYPVLLEYKKNKYIFYNGNGMGYTGVGYAILE